MVKVGYLVGACPELNSSDFAFILPTNIIHIRVEIDLYYAKYKFLNLKYSRTPPSLVE